MLGLFFVEEVELDGLIRWLLQEYKCGKSYSSGLNLPVDEGSSEPGTAVIGQISDQIKHGPTHRSSLARAWLAGLPFSSTCFS